MQAHRTEVFIAEGSKGGESETELVISSIAQGPAKNTIDKDRVDVLLTDDSQAGKGRPGHDLRLVTEAIKIFIDCRH